MAKLSALYDYRSSLFENMVDRTIMDLTLGIKPKNLGTDQNNFIMIMKDTIFNYY